jgi:hypothetical protein
LTISRCDEHVTKLFSRPLEDEIEMAIIAPELKTRAPAGNGDRILLAFSRHAFVRALCNTQAPSPARWMRPFCRHLFINGI